MTGIGSCCTACTTIDAAFIEILLQLQLRRKVEFPNDEFLELQRAISMFSVIVVRSEALEIYICVEQLRFFQRGGGDFSARGCDVAAMFVLNHRVFLPLFPALMKVVQLGLEFSLVAMEAI
ncbi:hypothetical protein Bca4012_064187 [Brassica carinata]